MESSLVRLRFFYSQQPPYHLLALLDAKKKAAHDEGENMNEGAQRVYKGDGLTVSRISDDILKALFDTVFLIVCRVSLHSLYDKGKRITHFKDRSWRMLFENKMQRTLSSHR